MIILVTAIFAVFDLPQPAGSDWSNLSGVFTGIVLILASLIFRCGAEPEEQAN